MNIAMSKKEIDEFLSKPLLARLATTDHKGAPNIHPMWFLYRDKTIIFSTLKGSEKTKNIKANPYVSVAIDVARDGLNAKGVVFKGTARIIEKNISEYTEELIIKYMGTIEHPFAKELMSMPRTIIIVKTTSIRSWDYTKMR